MSRRFQKVLQGCVLAALLGLGMPAASVASSASSGKIYNVIVLQNGIVLFKHTGTRSAVPTCGQPEANRWAFNGATAQGQARLALLLTAFGAGKNVLVYGTGNCADWGDTESLDFIVTE